MIAGFALVAGLVIVTSSVSAQDPVDNESALVVSESLTVAEGDTSGASYTVALSHAPTDEVTVTVTGQTDSDLNVGGLSDSGTLTFSTSNWNTPQTVTVTADDDDDRVDDSVTLTHTAAGAEFDGLTADLAVTVTDSAVLYEANPNADFIVEDGHSNTTTKFPTDVWGDGTTLWVAAARFYTVKYSNKRFAVPIILKFRREHGQVFLPAGEFDIDDPISARSWTANNDITGIWSDNQTTIWVLRGSSAEAFTNEVPDPARDFTLAGANTEARGLWSDGTTIWTADSGMNKVFAYALETGAEDSDRGFDLTEANHDAGGLWSDGTTMWVTDTSDEYTYAYTLSTGERNTSKEFSMSALGSNSGEGSARGLWSDGTTIWVANYVSDVYGFAWVRAFHMTGNPAAGGV